MRVSFILGANLVVFKLGKTTNEKISSGTAKIVQVYTYSLEQVEYIKSNPDKLSYKTFFDLANANCFDCPFRGYLKCYTHKFTQARGFVSSIKSILAENNILEYSSEVAQKLVNMCKDRYVRFGTYGEPSVLPLNLVEAIVKVSSTHTGYTHQWAKKPEFAPYFMASTHSIGQASMASKLGFRSFIATDKMIDQTEAISCPASKEQGYKSTCEKCGLCGGLRKGKKNIQILTH
jgi:hypothetical protein